MILYGIKPKANGILRRYFSANLPHLSTGLSGPIRRVRSTEPYEFRKKAPRELHQAFGIKAARIHSIEQTPREVRRRRAIKCFEIIYFVKSTNIEQKIYSELLHLYCSLCDCTQRWRSRRTFKQNLKTFVKPWKWTCKTWEGENHLEINALLHFNSLKTMWRMYSKIPRAVSSPSAARIQVDIPLQSRSSGC